jgi:HSP90 family molecular chaperone
VIRKKILILLVSLVLVSIQCLWLLIRLKSYLNQYLKNLIKLFLWESSGEEKYKLKEVTKENNGTDIIIYLNDDNKEFAEEGRVRFLLEKYSQYINFPLNLITSEE